MKYILIIICLFICSCSYKDNREDYNFLEDNSIRFIRNDTGIILLINKKRKTLKDTFKKIKYKASSSGNTRKTTNFSSIKKSLIN